MSAANAATLEQARLDQDIKKPYDVVDLVLENPMEAMKFQLLRTFVAVYEDGSLTAAAKRIHATQSALSMRLKELEATLAVRLFERTAAGVAPTPYAERLYPRATRILREISGIGEDLDELAGQITGTLHAGLMPSITRAALAPALDRFTTQYPLVEVQITEAYSAALTEEVTGGRMDFAIVPPGQAVRGLRARHIARDIELLVTAPTCARPHLSAVELSTLGPLKLVLPGPSNARREKLDTYLAAQGADVSTVLELDAMMATLDLVAKSDWVTILPGCLGYPDIDQHQHNLHPLRPSLTGDYVLIEPTARTMSAAAAAFAEAIAGEVAAICGFCSSTLA